MSDHPGIDQDRRHQATVPVDERCRRCEGTGNEFFAMYRRCSDCKGTGRRDPEEDSDAR